MLADPQISPQLRGYFKQMFGPFPQACFTIDLQGELPQVEGNLGQEENEFIHWVVE